MPIFSFTLAGKGRKTKMIKKYKKNNGTYAYLFVAYLGIDPKTGKQLRTTRRGFESYKEAKNAESRLLASLEEDKFNEGKYKFEDICNLWLEEYKDTVKESSYRQAKDRLKLHVLPLIGDYYIDKIDAVKCRDLVRDWAKKYKSASHMKIITQQILDHAVFLKLIRDNPMRLIKMPKTVKKDNDTGKFYDKEELQLFLKAADEYGDKMWNAFFRLLAFSGMRKGEVLALYWEDIDFNEMTINITRGMTLDVNRQPVLSTPKTASSIRIISIDPNTLQCLRRWKLIQAQYLLERGYRVKKSKQLVFSNNRNQLFHSTAPNKYLDEIIKQHNLKRITVHGFRHTHASLLFEIDTPMNVVQERLGHKEISTTMDVYAHVTVKKRDEYADKFAQYMNF